MKKILLLAVLLLPAVPSLMVGIKSQSMTNQERRDQALNERFHRWCDQEGYDYYGMTENQSEQLWCDVWMESEDYDNAVDSIDNVLSISNLLNQSM